MVKKFSTQWITFHDDTNEKGILRTILRKKFGIHVLQDEVLFFNKVSGHLIHFTPGYFTEAEILKRFWVHKPDLFAKAHKPQVVCEIDGDVHWRNSKAVKRTNARNCHYETAGLRFVWVTTEEVFASAKTKPAYIKLCEKIEEQLGILALA